jgi:hypothetical protein
MEFLIKNEESTDFEAESTNGKIRLSEILSEKAL